MENINKPTPEWMKGVDFWIKEIEKAGIYKQLRGFNDVITGKEAPHGYGGRF